MICHVFKTKRRRGGKLKSARLYSGRYRLGKIGPLVTVPLHTPDKQVAQQYLRRIVLEAERERAGLSVPKSMREAAQKAITNHVDDYCTDFAAKGRDAMYVYTVQKRLARICRESNWHQCAHVTADSFVSWRAKQSKAAKTLNEYQATLDAFFNWMKKQGRVLCNPLEMVGKVEERGRTTFERRAFTDLEVQRLLAVSDDRATVYLLAVNTGLRRAELEALRKADVYLNVDDPYLRARASTTKNHKDAVLWLNAEVVDRLRPLMAAGSPENPLFPSLPSMEQFRADLKAAGISYLDATGRRADFHALRHTLATNLALAGVASRVAMELMRHSDMRLTTKTYTDTRLLPTHEATQKLPRFLSTEKDTQIRTQKLGSGRPDASRPVSGEDCTNAHQTPDTIGDCQSVTSTDAACRKKKVVPRLGLEPRTNRLRVCCSTIELPRLPKGRAFIPTSFPLVNISFGDSLHRFARQGGITDFSTMGTRTALI